VKFFHLNALSSPILIKVHLDVVMTMIADTLYSRLVPRLINSVRNFGNLSFQWSRHLSRHGQRWCVVDNRFDKPTVSLASFFLPSWPAVRFDDVANVVALLGNKIDELKPIGRGYEPKIMLSDVAHKEKLTCKELAVHLIGFNREQSAETANRLLVQSLSSVGPAKWMGIELVPGFDKGHDSFPEAFYREEMTVSQALRLEDAKPYLNHVQPGCVEGDKMSHNAFVGGLKPLAALGACSEG